MARIKLVLMILVALFLITFFHYSLPQRDIVQVVGTEVVRMDVGSNSWLWASKDAGTYDSHTRDVRFVNTQYFDGDTMEFRNEDTGWSWPPYFKFASGTLQAEAQSFTRKEGTWVAVRHYGWRIPVLSMYPNVTSMKAVDGPDVRLIPWFNIIFLMIVAMIVWGVYVRIARWKDKNIDPVIEDIGDRFEDIGDTFDDIGDSVSETKGRVGRWLDTWRKKKP